MIHNKCIIVFLYYSTSVATTMVIVLIKLTCFALTGQMVYLQFQSYLENQDSSSVSYKSLRNDKEEAYPTFSLCFQRFRGGLFEESLGKSMSKAYYAHLVGRKPNTDLKGNNDSTKNNINFDNVVIKTFPLLQYHTYTKDGTTKEHFNKRSKKDEFHRSFVVTYQDSSRICFTKTENRGKGIEIYSKEILLNATLLKQIQHNIYVYVHQKQQLRRNLGADAFILNWKVLKESSETNKTGNRKRININIEEINVLKKRPDANTKCNNSVFNDDQRWINSVIIKVGCIPDYWKRLALNSSLSHESSNISSCNQKKYQILGKYSIVSKFERMYLQPCMQMNTIVTSTQTDLYMDRNHENTVKFVLKYKPTEYKETINNKAFDMNTLWSQIGGFVGIFLGYSLVQIAAPIGKLEEWVKRRLSNRELKNRDT